QVLAEAGGVLRDEAELLDARGLELLRLDDETLDGAAAVAPAPHRDGAERTRVVATFGDLEVRVAARREEARRRVVEHQVRRRRQRRAAAELHHLVHLAALGRAHETLDISGTPLPRLRAGG